MTDFKTLLLRAKENDQAAFEEILAMYRPLLLKESIINGRMDMDEDLFQELSLPFSAASKQSKSESNSV